MLEFLGFFLPALPCQADPAAVSLDTGRGAWSHLSPTCSRLDKSCREHGFGKDVRLFECVSAWVLFLDMRRGREIVALPLSLT